LHASLTLNVPDLYSATNARFSSTVALQIPVLRNLLQLQLVSSLIQGFPPSLVLLTFLAVLPYSSKPAPSLGYFSYSTPKHLHDRLVLMPLTCILLPMLAFSHLCAADPLPAQPA
jgi:hypothetical protein